MFHEIRRKSYTSQDRFDQVIQILKSKAPQFRSQEELQKLAFTLQKHSFLARFLNEYKVFHDIMQQLNYCFVEANKSVVHDGQSGEEIYFVLTGQIQPNLDCFGMELLKGSVYKQTIVTKTEAHFATISKSLVKKMQQQNRARDSANQLEFLRQSQLFGRLSRSSLFAVLQLLRVEFFTAKQVVYKEGDSSDYLYIVKEGEFELQKKFRMRSKLKRVPIARIGVCEVFGELEALMNKPRQYSVVCKRDAICYRISGDAFYSEVIAENPNTDLQNYINQYIKVQTINRNERLATVGETLEDNCNYLFGFESHEARSPTESDLKKIELRIADKTHSRYAPIYNQKNHQKIKVRYATIYKQNIAVPRCTSKAEDERVISVSVTKSPQKQRLANIYDEIDVPDQIKRKYQQKLQELQKQVLSLRKQQYKIRTYNNQSQIIANN